MMLVAPPSTSPAESAENRASEFFAIDATSVLARYYTVRLHRNRGGSRALLCYDAPLFRLLSCFFE
jgi:hypothetical protein